ncbi:MAG TPA: YoaK family protein [Candidatus Udaeobacter sp.]|nr:YoaK family protein [Candidatus Udaeobacter sp.]
MRAQIHEGGDRDRARTQITLAHRRWESLLDTPCRPNTSHDFDLNNEMFEGAMPTFTTLGRESMLLVLTLAAGSVDAISYLGLGHVFTAMMTGNIVLLGLAVAQGEVLAGLRSIVALIGFALGVFVGAVIVERESKQTDWPPPITAALALETALIAIFAATYYLTGTGGGAGITNLLIVLLALAMGTQSAAVRRLGVPGIATTYITGTLTSLMVDLLGWLRSIAAPLPTPKPAERGSVGRRSTSMPWEQRVGLLAGVVSLYCLGALAGGILEEHSSRLAGFLPLAALLLVVLNALIRHYSSSDFRS